MTGRDPRSRVLMGGANRSAVIIALFAAVVFTLAPPAARAADGGTTTTTTPGSTTTTTPPKSTSTSVGTTTTTIGSTTTTGDSDSVDGGTEEDQELLEPPSITFPLVGRSTFRDTYGASREDGARVHLGTDLIADKGTPIVAAAKGVVETIGEGDQAGLYVVVRHTDGWRSAYVHMNNDSPGTDNGLTVGFAPGLRVGSRVEPGTLLGYVGDSGNAEETVAHLHFELQQPDGLKINPYEPLKRARRVRDPRPLPVVDYDDVVTEGTELVGHVATGAGFNAGVAALDDFVYMGTSGNAERCPGTGVRVIDVSDPAAPEVVASFADHLEFTNTATPDLWVGRLTTPTFTGTVGVVAVQSCVQRLTTTEEPVSAGLAIYDLTDPLAPALLSVLNSGATTGGVETLDVTISEDRVLVAASVPRSHQDTLGVLGAVRIVDISDPRAPRPVADWQPPEAGSLAAGSSVAAAGSVSGVAWVTADTLIVGRESGELFKLSVTGDRLSISDTVQWGDPEVTQTTVVRQSLGPHGAYILAGQSPRIPTESEDETGRLLLIDADLSPTDAPAAIAPFTLPEEDDLAEGYFLPGGSTDAGPSRAVVAWMSGGVQVLDLSDPHHPAEIGRFVTAPAVDPQRWWVGPEGGDRLTLVWDVAESRGYFYAVDHNSGLWVFTIDGTPPLQTGPDALD